MFRRLRKKATVYLVRFFLGMSSFIPYRMAQKLGAVLGSLAYYVLAKYRKRALRHLKERLQVNDDKARFLAKRIFKNQGMNFTEFFYLQRIQKEHFNKYYKIINLENIRKAYARKKGVLVITAHFGNWESIVPVISQSGFTVNVITRRYHIKELDEILVKLRTRMGYKIIQRGEAQAAKQILRALKSGEIIGMVVDQNVKSIPNIDVDFFGKNAPTPVGMVTLALGKGCSIVPCFSRRDEKGVHVLECLPEVELEKTGDRQQDVFLNTQKITGIIESVVRKHPDQWVWFHRRWSDS